MGMGKTVGGSGMGHWRLGVQLDHVKSDRSFIHTRGDEAETAGWIRLKFRDKVHVGNTNLGIVHQLGDKVGAIAQQED